jgi:hypothetical protein
MSAEYKTIFDCVIAEINGGLFNAEMVMKLFRKNFIIKPNGFIETNGKRFVYYCHSSRWETNECCLGFTLPTCFGEIGLAKNAVLVGYEEPCKRNWSYKYKCRNRYRCGVEVLGMRPNRTKDGKYKYEGKSIKDLKNACKANGIKGYSSCKEKVDIVKLLMKV